MKATKYRTGAYNFNDLDDVIELYIPEDAKTNPTPTLHIRGRELLPHHLQHYFVPYRKVFIVVKVAAIQLTSTTTIGLLCEHYRWRKGFNPAWKAGENYWADIRHVKHNGAIYVCDQQHISSLENQPPSAFWRNGQDPEDLTWKLGQPYVQNQFVWLDYDWNGIAIPSGYRAWQDHESTPDREPGVGVDWETYWDIGDEMQSDLSWPYSGAHIFRRLALSNGTTKPFDKDVLAAFHGYTGKYSGNIEGKAIDALTVAGTMKAGGIIYGIEVDEADPGYEY